VNYAEETNGRERREHPRVPVEWPISITLAGSGDSDGTRCEARLRDVSRAGICFFLDRPIPEMTVLRMELDLPPVAGEADGGRVNGGGVVVRCQAISPQIDHFEIAVFLNDVDEASRLALAAHVNRSQASR